MMNHLNPLYMWGLFTKKMLEYDFSVMRSNRSNRYATSWARWHSVRTHTSRLEGLGLDSDSRT